MMFDPMYLLFMAPAFLLSMWASFRTKAAFNKYSKVRVMSGETGAHAAQLLLNRAGITDVTVVRTQGVLTDHYNPADKTLALSQPVHSSNSVAAVGVACHEAGHAIQHAQGYKPLAIRSLLVKPASFGSNLGFYVMLGGLFLQATNMVLFGAVLFSFMLLFQIVTLPVEFDASTRAKELAFQYGIVNDQERVGVERVLNAAALTYVGAAFTTLLTLLYFLARAGLLGSSRD